MEEPDHERVACDARIQVISESSSEIVTRARAERFASAKPNESSGLETLAKSREARVHRVCARERSAIEALAVDQSATPLAVTPELELSDGSIRGVFREKIESFRPTSCADGGVDATEPPIEIRARMPSQTEGSRRADSLCRVVDEQTKRRHPRSLRLFGGSRLEGRANRPVFSRSELHRVRFFAELGMYEDDRVVARLSGHRLRSLAE